MKTTKYLFTAFGSVTLALAACTNDDLPSGNTLPEGAVHITAGIEGVQTRAPQLDADGAGSFEPADMWGMYTFTGDATSPAFSNENIAYQADNSTPLYWKDLSETEAVTFSAHYPRITADIANPAAYLYVPEAWNHTDDLLHATTTASKDGTVALTFKHLMHRLVVNLTAGDGMTGTDLSSALINSVAKNNAPTMFASVEVNLLTGAVNYGSATGSVILSNGGGANADWIVAPQDLTAGAEWLKITIDGDVWYYHVPADLNTTVPGNQTRLESGKRLTLNLTLKKNPDTGNTVTLTGSSISGWDTQLPITDEVVIGGTTSGITTYEALHEALQTGGGSADAPTLITLGSDITIPAGGSSSSRTYINGSGYFKIDGGGHTLAWEAGSYYFLGNANTDADAVYIELTNIKLVQAPNLYSAVVGVWNGRITLGGNVILDGNGNMPVIVVSDEKAALELGDGCELSYAAGSSGCAKVVEGATLVLNGGKIADGAYINLHCILPVSNPLISVPKALTDDVHLKLYLVDIISIAGGTGGYQLTQADCDRLKVTSESWVSLYGGQSMEYDGNFEFYLDQSDNQIKLCPKGFTPPTSGDIDMTSMTADEAQLTIRATLAAGYTEIKLTGELSKTGMGDGQLGAFAYNTKITKCDLSGVTGWGATPTLPDNAFSSCTALKEVVLPDDVQVIGESAFFNCTALTTVNLPQVTRIDQYAFQVCTSLAELTLDKVAAIDKCAFYECTSLETLKLPACTRFGDYIVTGCSSLTRIEAAAAGDFVNIDDDTSNIGNTSVFQNRAAHSGANAFNPANCDLVLNADKKPDGTALPKVDNGNEWAGEGGSGFLIQWKSISFP
ncbi:fimbrillin family protein [Bacteroides thetaiotaomicron]|uniref:fimbrillin family protein n=1 Tax=Bacteroides thetaiotaomicron TaxID=818 RepID=UPI00232E4E1F|nr:fimbrillin family protein [Bacteroides thetaiotaomicron]MDC2006832.1 fimbrillin family protein [Bacteroides thetaiotaomicron]MDC2020667.1 fimbrillin family protein [Bacteroides thetaiotaomicron]MDC2024575.1 fimbrillin family protein [Bacteroides thetaiotaomicron]MDC2029627.1 fimbrillin family protein [Bacteroides thetaiotaomicron]MDC2060087.1 fimbrillin family protein [Bacteroides thetaiotaomicron]